MRCPEGAPTRRGTRVMGLLHARLVWRIEAHQCSATCARERWRVSCEGDVRGQGERDAARIEHGQRGGVTPRRKQPERSIETAAPGRVGDPERQEAQPRRAGRHGSGGVALLVELPGDRADLQQVDVRLDEAVGLHLDLDAR